MRGLQLSLLLMSMSLLVSCLDERVVSCRDGLLCPDGTACDDAHRGCVLPEQLERCDGQADGETCSYRGTRDGACYEGVCLPAGCGNGVADEGEVCDDGNRLHGDGCSADCRSNEMCGNRVVDVTKGESCEPPGTEFCRTDCVTTRCGDGVVDEGDLEACDLGAANAKTPDAACRPNCQLRRCGDGVRDSDEVCDDGNNLVGDGCSSDCKSTEQCGNGVVDVAAGESCEPPGTDFCRAGCVTTRCGDGTLDTDAFEQCDDGAQNSREPDAACRPNCQPRRCGDGIRDSSEACDDGNQRNGDGCSYDCLSDETCGNGYLDLARNEECDNGNLLNHDGCSSTCLTESPQIENFLPGSIGSEAPAHDIARNQWVGLTSSATSTLDEIRWLQRSTLHHPNADKLFAMTWDAGRDRVVLFGGESVGYRPLDGTWEWDGADWQLIPHQGQWPPARTSAALVYDHSRRVSVLFGGRTIDANTDIRDLGDTWEWDGSAWTQYAPLNLPAPGPAIATYDPRKGRVVLFDGKKVWSWTGRDWEASEYAPPRERVFTEPVSILFNLKTQQLVLHYSATHEHDGSPWGGDVVPSFWTLADSGWSELTMPRPFPELGSLGTSYSSTREGIVAFRDSRVVVWNGTEWETARASSDAGPGERVSSALTFDPLRGKTYLFGGWVSSANSPLGGESIGDTWSWEGSTWFPMNVGDAPGARSSHAMAYDASVEGTVLFGDGAGTYTFDGVSWYRYEAPDPTRNRTAAMATSAGYRGITLLAGTGGGRDVSESWRWSAGQWQRIHSTNLPGSCGGAMVYEPIMERVLYLGGNTCGEPFPLAELWSLAGDEWTLLPAVAPDARRDHAAVFDANRRAVVVVGGEPNEVWELPVQETQTPEWRVLDGVAESLPYTNGKHAAYEATKARVLVFGFHTANAPSTAAFSYSAPAQPDEACRFGFDTDGDSLIGCDDPDCWPFCTPLCPPGAPCDLTYPHCGDGECNEALETCRMCPEDCGACPALCGDFFCDAPETIDTCPGDCTPP